MAMGRRETERQQDLFITHDRLPRAPGHAFYAKLNGLLAEAEFDRWVEALCEPYYADGRGRPSLPPGVYFRMLFVGYFEGISLQRGIAWRCSDSLSLREFLGIPLGKYAQEEDSPEHSSVSYIRSLPADGSSRTGVRQDADPRRRQGAASRQDGGGRLDDARSQRGDEEHRPPRHRRRLRRILDAADARTGSRR